MTLLLLLLLACGESEEPRCDPRLLDAGEVRARRVPCGDELIEGGEGRRSDWLIENAVARYVIRDAAAALTQLEGAGGTIVDAAAPGGTDALVELVPQIGGEWLADAEIEAGSEEGAAWLEVRGSLPGGAAAAVRYVLAADDPRLRIEGADGATLVPLAGSERYGQTLEILGATLGVDADLAADRGGWTDWADLAGLVVGDRDAVYTALWPDGAEVAGAASGERVEALAGGEVIARLPIDDGAFAGLLPPETAQMRAVAAGHAAGDPQPVSATHLPLGAPGWLRVRVTDGSGAALPATLLWRGQSWPVLPGEGPLPLGAGTGEAALWAGPGRELHREPLRLVGEAGRNVALPWAVTPALLAALPLASSPDPTVRRSPGDVLAAAAGLGVGYAVLVAEDEVSSADPDAGEPWTPARAGSRSGGPGEPFTWSWAPTINRPAHGAVPWAGLPAEDLLALMSPVGTRLSAVGMGWIEAAGSPLDWQPRPDLLRLEGLGDLAGYAALLDDWVALPPVGPLTWIEGVDLAAYSAVDAEAMLLEGRSIATNGPRLVLAVDGAGPGAVLEPKGAVTATLRVEAPTWLPVAGASLVGPGGAVLATWALAEGEALRLDASVTLDPPPAWVLAICWGEAVNPPFLAEPAWAITGPVWLARP